MKNKKLKVLALGADIKNRILFTKSGSFNFGRDIADLSYAQNLTSFRKEVARVAKGIEPDIISCDLHPHYLSSVFARELAPLYPGCSVLPIQHHHAHIASVMQEHNLKGPAIGVCFDGTGYGQDGNSWGGEFLLVDKSRFKRLGYLKYRMMPGSDKVVSEPWRMVLSILGKRAIPFLRGVNKKDQEIILKMMSKNINSPKTSSAGRLFDAAAALLGVCRFASFEAEGPLKLEAICQEKTQERYRFKIFKENGCSVIDTDGLFLGMLDDLKQGRSRRLIATKFHNSVAQIIVATVKRLSRFCGLKDIALSGGVFQNNFLKTKVKRLITDSNLNLFTNLKTPVNDLNISLGQYYACCCLRK
jgi:hydrogenase maturation protein HypF